MQHGGRTAHHLPVAEMAPKIISSRDMAFFNNLFTNTKVCNSYNLRYSLSPCQRLKLRCYNWKLFLLQLISCKQIIITSMKAEPAFINEQNKCHSVSR